MDKSILTKYIDAKGRLEILQKRLEKTKEDITQLEKEQVQETVLGGEGGWQRFTVYGCPVGIISKKKTVLMQQQLRYQQEEANLLEITNDVEEFIQDIDDPLTRSIIEMRILDGETFVQIGHKLGYSADACRKKFDRFIEKK